MARPVSSADVVRQQYPRGGTDYWIVGRLPEGVDFGSFCVTHVLRHDLTNETGKLIADDFRARFPDRHFTNLDFEPAGDEFNAGSGSFSGDDLHATLLRDSRTVAVKVRGATGY